MKPSTNEVLVKALRAIANHMESADGLPQQVLLEAADRIERLKSDLQKEQNMVAVLKLRIGDLEFFPKPN